MDLEYYQPPVSELLSFGDCREIPFETDYIEKFGFTEEHIPDLIQMAIDPDLNWAYSDSLEVWAPIHAWRSLGQLRATGALKPLLSLMDDLKDSDWYTEELPSVLVQMGPIILPELIAYLANPHYNSLQRAIITESIALIGKQYPEFRDESVKILTRRLADYKSNPNELNGWIVCSLMDLKAVESASVIETGFAADAINPFIAGDWNEVQIKLGLKTREELPEPDNTIHQNLLEAMHEYSQNHPETNSLGFGTGLPKNPAKTPQKKKKNKNRK